MTRLGGNGCFGILAHLPREDEVPSLAGSDCDKALPLHGPFGHVTFLNDEGVSGGGHVSGDGWRRRGSRAFSFRSPLSQALDLGDVGRSRKRSAPQDPVSCPLIGGTKDPGEETIKFRWSITP